MKLELNIPHNKPFDAVGIGLNAIDHIIVMPHFPERGTKSRISKFVKAGGGQMGTGFSALARLGAKVKYLGKVGDDEMGKLSMDLLAREGVDISDMVVEPDTISQYAFIVVEEGTGERTIMWQRDSGLEFSPGDFSREAVTSGRILHMDGHEVPFLIQAAKWAKEEGIPVLIDAERLKDRTFELLPLADVLISDERFLNLVYPGSTYREFLIHVKERFNPHFAAITLGERGSLGYLNGEFIYLPAFRVDVADTTGAGDVYHAAFVYGILQDWEIEEIMRFSSAVAALKCRKYGGRDGAPNLTEVREFLMSDPEVIQLDVLQ